MMRWQRKLCRFGHQRDRSTRRRPAHGEPLLLRAAARKNIPIARLGNSTLHPQTCGSATLRVEQRRGVDEAPRFCLSFSSPLTFTTLLRLTGLTGFVAEIVYRVFTQKEVTAPTCTARLHH